MLNFRNLWFYFIIKSFDAAICVRDREFIPYWRVSMSNSEKRSGKRNDVLEAAVGSLDYPGPYTYRFSMTLI